MTQTSGISFRTTNQSAETGWSLKVKWTESRSSGSWKGRDGVLDVALGDEKAGQLVKKGGCRDGAAHKRLLKRDHEAPEILCSGY